MMVARLTGEGSTTQMVFPCKTPQIYSVPAFNYELWHSVNLDRHHLDGSFLENHHNFNLYLYPIFPNNSDNSQSLPIYSSRLLCGQNVDCQSWDSSWECGLTSQIDAFKVMSPEAFGSFPTDQPLPQSLTIDPHLFYGMNRFLLCFLEFQI